MTLDKNILKRIMTSIPGDFANARRCGVDDTCNHNMEVVNEIDTLPELPKDKSQRIKGNLYKNKGRKCIWTGKDIEYRICQYKGCVKETKKKYCNVCNQTIEIENIDIDDIKNRIKTQDKVKLSDLIKYRRGKWSCFKNHIIYGLWLENKLGFTKHEHWYNISARNIKKYDGAGLLMEYYEDSPLQFVQAVFPHYNLFPWKFSQVPHKYWEELDNKRDYINWLGEKLKYTTMEHWYKITIDIMIKNCGYTLIRKYYDGCLRKLLIDVFPDYEWLPWNFSQVQHEYWDELDNRIYYAKWLGKKLGYTTKEDWYKISQDLINEYKGGGMLQFDVVDIFVND